MIKEDLGWFGMIHFFQEKQAQKLGKDASENPNILNNKFQKINNQKFSKYFEKSKEYFKAKKLIRILRKS